MRYVKGANGTVVLLLAEILIKLIPLVEKTTTGRFLDPNGPLRSNCRQSGVTTLLYQLNSSIHKPAASRLSGSFLPTAQSIFTMDSSSSSMAPHAQYQLSSFLSLHDDDELAQQILEVSCRSLFIELPAHGNSPCSLCCRNCRSRVSRTPM